MMQCPVVGEIAEPENQGKSEKIETSPKAPEDASWAQLQALAAITGGLVGAAAYLYLLGGLVVWLKLKAAQLPTDDAMRVLDRNRLLAVGIKAALIEAVLLGVLLLLAILTWKWVKDSKGKGSGKKGMTSRAPVEQNSKWETWKILLHGVIAAILASALISKWADLPWGWAALLSLVVGAVWALQLMPLLVEKLKGARLKWWRWGVKTGLTILAGGLAIFLLAAPAGVLVLVLLLFLHLSHLLQKLVDVNNPVTLVPAVVGMAAAMSLVIAVYIATPPVSMDRATVYLEGGAIVRGGYVGQTSEGVFLADCNADPVDPEVSTHVKLRIISADQVNRIRLGGDPFIVDYGEDPSLFDFSRYFFSRDPVDEWTNTMALDLRPPELTCGRRHSLQLLLDRAHSRPIRSVEVKVLGKGTVELQSEEFEPETQTSRMAGRATLALIPGKEARRENRCGGVVRGTISVSFALDDGGAKETREAEVARRLKSRQGPQCRHQFLFQSSTADAR